MLFASPLIAALLFAWASLFGQVEPVDALIQRGDRERLQDQYAAALDSYSRARDLAEAAGDPRIEADAWNGLGVVYRTQSDFPRALDALWRCSTARTIVCAGRTR